MDNNQWHHRRMALILALVFSWLLSSLIINIAIVPQVFRTIGDPVLAGKIGVKLFARYNLVEIFLGAFISLLSLTIPKEKGVKAFQGISFFLLILVISYAVYISPSIAQSAKEMALAKEKSDMALMKNSTEALHFFHHLYIKLDAGKLVFLLGLTLWQGLRNIGKPARS